MFCSNNFNQTQAVIIEDVIQKALSTNAFRRIDFNKMRQIAPNDVLNNINAQYGENLFKKEDNNIVVSPSDELINEYIGRQQSKILLSNDSKVEVARDHNVDHFASTSQNRDELSAFLNFPEISEFTYEKLLQFMNKLNPDFSMESLSNLSVSGESYIKDFLIRVNSFDRLKAMPEEVSHFFVELLPKDSEMRQDMLKNIINFPIYSHTYNQYKNVYKNENGTPDVDRIKREAAAKLISEYIYAISTGDKSRVDSLTKVKQGWVKTWLNKFLKWIGLTLNSATKVYAEAGAQILAGDIDTSLNERLPEDQISDKVWYQLTTDEAYGDALKIYDLKPPRLLDTIQRFRREFNDKFMTIVRDEKFKDIDQLLRVDPNDKNSLNKLDELSQLLKGMKIDLDDTASAYDSVQGILQFLQVIDRLSVLSDAIYHVTISKDKAETFAEALNNIRELESYFSLYESFDKIIGNDLVKILVDEIGKGKDAMEDGVEHPGRDLINNINKTKQKFQDVNSFIVNRLESDFFIFYKEIFKNTNDNITKELMDSLEKEMAKPSPNKEIVKEIKTKLNKHTQSDEKILKMLSNRGGDIDTGSNFNHLVNAAITNGNMYVSGIVKYIQDNIYKGQSKTVEEVTNLYEDIDKLEKALGENVYQTGKAISFVETQYDPTTESGTRDVLVFLNPFKGATLARTNFKNEINELKRAIPKDKNAAGYSEAIDKLIAKSKEYENWQQKYMNRPYTKEYYGLQSEYENNADFIDIWTKWKDLTQDIRRYEDAINNGDPVSDEIYNELVLLRREKAFLLQETDEYNNPKTDEEIRKVNILKDYFEKGSKFREVDILQTNRAYEADRLKYEQKINIALKKVEEKNFTDIKDVEAALRIEMGDSRIRLVGPYNSLSIKGDIDYEMVKGLLEERWIKNNNIIAPNDQYWEDVKFIMEQLAELQNKGQLSARDIHLKNLYEEKRNLLFGYRDSKRQIDPTLIPQDKIDRINDIEFEIEEFKRTNPAAMDFSEFSPEDLAAYQKYQDIIKTSKKMAERLAAQKRVRDIQKKYKNTDKAKDIKALFELLASLSSKSATDYYWDKMDLMLTAFDEMVTEFVKDATPEEEKILRSEYKRFEEAINNNDSETLDFDIYETQLFGEFLDWMSKNKKHEKLYSWFINSHVDKNVWDDVSSKYVKLNYVRSTIYTQSIPNAPEHISTSKTRKHTRLRIKNEHRTGYNPATGEVELKEGEHIDNKGEWLPLSVEQGQTDKTYINEEYYKLKNSKDAKDKLRFQYLQKLVGTNLNQQNKVDKKLRGWMNVPVMELDKLEEKEHIINHAGDTLKQGVEKVKGLFKRNEADDADSQIEGMDTIEDIDQYTKEAITQRLPKLGMAQKIPVDRVSKNLLGATAAFIGKANEYDARNEAQPIVSALIRLFKNNNLNGANNKQITAIFEKLYSQMILSEVPDSLTNSRFVKRFTKIISSTTGLRLLMDIPGGLINYGSAQINNLIEASAGKYMTMRDYARGNYLAGIMTRDIIADYSRKSGLSYYTLLFDTFDFIQGEFEEDLISRSSHLGKKASIRSHMMLPRKGGELHAQSATALGIMNKVKVKNQIDGEEYPLHEIYKVEGNNLVLKDGFYELDEQGNKSYPYNPVDGSKYLNVKKLINRVNLELHGNYAKINQTEASRHSIGKLVENMKRWFTTGFTRRWGRELPDISYEDLNEGYYLSSFKALYNVFLRNALTFDVKNGKDWWNYYASSPRYKANLRRMGMDMATWGLLFFGFALALGYNGDDKDKKLTQENWVSQMAILTLIRMYSEATAYLPVPSMGLQELKRNLFSPLSLPMDTFSNAAAVAQLGAEQTLYAFGMDSFKNDLYYSKDGGYWFSERGDSKLVKYMLKSIGYNGYFLEPGQYVKDFGKLQGRLK